MRQTISSNGPEVAQRVRPPAISGCSARFLTSRLAKPILLLFILGALAVASPSYAQRGGGASGGGHSGGVGSFGGGGGGHPSSAGRGGSGGTSHSGGDSRGSSTSTSTRKADSVANRSGFSAAVRRFLGLPSSPKAGMNGSSRVAGGVSPSTSLMGDRTAPSGVPAAYGRVHLTRMPSAFGEGRSSAIPAISAPPRPIPPHPHPRWGYPYYPPGYGCYACGFDFGFGFGLPLFYFGYWNWSPPFWHGSTQSTVSMLLYMQDGSGFEVTDYWVDGDILDYVTVDGKQGNVVVAILDLQRTIDANARIGLKFTLDRTQRGKPFERVPQQPDPANQPQPEQDPGRVEIEKQKSD
jgi:hypothetical protein